MADTRQQLAEVAFSAALVGVGFLLGGPVLAAVVGGIGVDLLADRVQQGFRATSQQLLGTGGFLNHDLQCALRRAFVKALAHLETAWWQTPAGAQLRRAAPDRAREAEQVFKLLREHAADFCSADGLGRAAGNSQVQTLLYADVTAARRAMASCLAGYLHGHDEQLVAFLDSHLVHELAFWFGEELKADRPDSNRAWRAFQRMLLEGLKADLAEMKTAQRETLQAVADTQRELQAWAERMDALSADVRETSGHSALLASVSQARSDLLVAIEAEGGQTRAAVEAGIQQIARLLSEEVGRLRQEILPLLRERNVSEGPAPLRADMLRSYDAFFREYALFGGRGEELAAIDAFIVEPQRPYLFVTGPSGYGKTALLAELARQGTAVYHFLRPYSGLADENTLLLSLCQQLAGRHGLGGELPKATAELRALYLDLLCLPPADGRPVAVLIDGLDEAAGWEPGPLHFPPDLPPGVKVILSARQVADVDWPARLGIPADKLQPLVLGVLKEQDVSALLEAAGGPATPLADDGDLVKEVLRISAGDPFYVKLLVEDLRDGRLASEQVGAQPTGLDGYLRAWWLQVARAAREKDVQQVLGSLAVVLGRLRSDDLVAIYPDLAWALDGVLAEVRRFVIGDYESGYALCHPRFADYVRRRVGARVVQKYTDDLLSWCSHWREHLSTYALSYYARHLAQAGRALELRRLLLDYGWMRAKLGAMGIEALLSDYGLPAGDDEETRLVAGALAQSAHVLRQDPAQLPSQLTGRLLCMPEGWGKELLGQARALTTTPWLRPCTGSLVSPKDPLLCTLRGHTNGVLAVAIAQCDTRVISGSLDTTIRIWDIETGAEVRTLTGHNGPVTSLAVTSDGGNWSRDRVTAR
jgi:hypothetical protein